MLTCPKCGTENPLGRVFCGGCGGKLDLSNMSSEMVANQQRPNFVQMHWRKALGILILLLLAVTGLAFWPQTTPFGEEGRSSGASKVRSRMRTLASQSSGRVLKAEFAEADVNAYLKFSRIRRTRIRSFTVSMDPGVLNARIMLPVKTIKVGSKKVVLEMSYDVACSSMGGQLYISSAKIGHLPALGPLKKVAVMPFLKLMADGVEAKLMKAASGIEFQEGKAIVSVGE
ncbi:MAG: zinc ribbon domain-containing protein [Kiritimatiellae bacterium]|nr:zinc ribbon domain-containing protein [Kiritimatiellia bacterium]